MRTKTCIGKTKVCRVCSVDFIQQSNRQIFCDTICQGAFRRNHSRIDEEYRLILLNDPCSYCGSKSSNSDHIVPVASGGALCWENLTASCSDCNKTKNARSLLVYLGIRTIGLEWSGWIQYIKSRIDYRTGQRVM